jgi:hypothetical protein
VQPLNVELNPLNPTTVLYLNTSVGTVARLVHPLKVDSKLAFEVTVLYLNKSVCTVARLVHPLKVSEKAWLPTTVLYLNKSVGTVARLVHPLKVLKKLLADVTVLKSPAGIDVKLVQFEKVPPNPLEKDVLYVNNPEGIESNPVHPVKVLLNPWRPIEPLNLKRSVGIESRLEFPEKVPLKESAIVLYLNRSTGIDPRLVHPIKVV